MIALQLKIDSNCDAVEPIVFDRMLCFARLEEPNKFPSTAVIHLSKMKSFLSIAGLSTPSSACVARRTLFMSVSVPDQMKPQN